MSRLFEEPESVVKAPARSDSGQVIVGVAVAANVWSGYDYVWPERLGTPKIGQRVKVSFGRGGRMTIGVVVRTEGHASDRKLKVVGDLIDAESPFDPVRWELGNWISRYYLSPLGMTLTAMIPSAVGKHAPRTETVVFLDAEEKDIPSSLGARQKRVLDELLEARIQGIEPLGLKNLMNHSGASRNTISRLKDRELIRTESRPVTIEDMNPAAMEPDAIEPNEHQQTVIDQIASRLGEGFSAMLLHGVTGSGKTEVYIRAIRKVVAAGKQAIVLVPEIALATQTLQRLVRRLPRVAVLHSGLTDTQRAFYYQQIRLGHAAVVVGPRSAIFAPTPNLGLIVVDEEHESSYKQDTAPRYHGRDVAVMRASLEKVPIVLGSATPSLESLHNVHRKRYELLKLPVRVRSLPMPSLKIVSLRQEIRPGKVELLGRTLTQQLAVTLDAGQQAILLMNRRGFASFVFCPSCKWELGCDNCTRPMVFHQATEMAICHYCQGSVGVPDRCPACGGKLLLFGMGIQRVENELGRKFPGAKFARVDSDTMTSPKQFKKVFDDFSSGELDILLGTQMVGKGLDFPGVSLVGVLSADTALQMPDFRAAERTFQLIVQVAGRAGRSDLPGRVVVQTLHPDEPSIIYASQHDYNGFAEIEMSQRSEANLPPFSRMIRFVVRHEKANKAQDGADELARALRVLLPAERIFMMGPAQAGIIKLRKMFRYEITVTPLSGPSGWVQNVLYPQMGSLSRSNPAEVVIDVDPMNLM
ncbi:MAG: primosomal protein N' [Phycisphaerales bacterium]|nr:primosomal protein N' [Phycisphaerales bacterium]